jgi:hypothetical protein
MKLIYSLFARVRGRSPISSVAVGKAKSSCFERALLVLGLVMLLALGVRAQTVTQTLALRAGWNAVWLDIEPTNSNVNVVLAGVPLVSLWTFADRITSVDFIEDLNEPVWNRARWLVHVPTNRLESFQNTLFTMPAKRAYLLQVSNAFTLRVTGRPLWRNRPWTPDAYTLRGFPVDPENPPDFNTFFRPSAAHADRATGQLQKIYRLNSFGQWSLVSPGDRITYGEAYWVYTKGGSDYIAPLEVRLVAGDSLDFGASVSSTTLGFKHQNGSSVGLSLPGNVGPSPLVYQPFTPGSRNEWVAFTDPLVVPPSAAHQLRLAIRRNNLTSGRYTSVLEIRDGAGTRIQLGVSAMTPPATENGAGGRNAAANGFKPAAVDPADPAGLWVGNAKIDSVNEVNSTAGAADPKPVGNHFSLRLMVHVDGSGTARLLKEVVQMWQNGTTTEDANGEPVAENPGRFVLVTDERLFPNFRGATLLDGTSVGRRLSTIGYDFDAPAGSKALTLTGAFGGDHVLSGTIQLDPQFPTNPFRHKFHPDHDNRNTPPGRTEVYQVTRQIFLQFSNAPPPGVQAMDYGYLVKAGAYRETVTGLNKTPITCQGIFQLRRVCNVAVLNQ